MSGYAKYECLKVEVSDKVATVTLNRPQARNAINQKLIRELRTIWDDLADDHAVNVVVLTGAGDFFSVGGDVKAMSERPGGDVLEEGEVHDPMISRRGVIRQLGGDAPGCALPARQLSDGVANTVFGASDDHRIGAVLDDIDRNLPSHAGTAANHDDLLGLKMHSQFPR